MKNVTTKIRFCCKPKIIIDYNKEITAIDLFDQMGAYNSPLRRSLKWYTKLVFNLLLNTDVVNALHMFQNVIGSQLQHSENNW